MTQQNFAVAPSRFSVGGVIGAGLPLLRRNFWQFFAVAFILGIPIMILSTLLAQVGAVPTPMPAGSAPSPTMPLPAGGIAGSLLSAVVGFVGVLTYFVIQSAINYGTLQDLRGDRPAVAPCIARGLALLPRVFVAALLLFVAMFALTLLVVLVCYLIAVGIAATTGHNITVGTVSIMAALGVIGLALFLFVTLWVFVPSIVVEDAGPIGCFRRSRVLTKGHRWGIVGIAVLVFLANFLCSIVISLIGHSGAVATAALLNVVVGLAFTALSSVLTAIGYYALRAEKEGYGLGDLARVFE
ncbi:MAG TPA: hypothetical protein VHE77_20355 [Dongiaceae bacterium]|nr:hypothetical protein [Dongiaceae bacterium]